MNFELIRASNEYKSVIRNLMQFYIYDFSEFVKCDVEEDGSFGAYPYLEDYWRDVNHRFPYVIKQNDKYVGFVIVRLIESEERSYFSIAEFFIWNKVIDEFTQGKFKNRCKEAIARTYPARLVQFRANGLQ